MFRSRYGAFTLLLTVVASACGSPAGPSTGSSKEAFFAALRLQGAIVTPGEILSRESNPFFQVQAQVVEVNTGTVNVFEYPDAAAARQDAAKVSLDGSTVGNTKILWIGPPHFYRKDRIIVIYVGHEVTVTKPLDTVLGIPFAVGH